MDTPRTDEVDKIIAKLDACHETNISFVLRQLVNLARRLQSENWVFREHVESVGADAAHWKEVFNLEGIKNTRLCDKLAEARNPTKEMIERGAEYLYGHPREKAIEWAKEEKFDSCAKEALGVYLAMLKPQSTQASDNQPDIRPRVAEKG